MNLAYWKFFCHSDTSNPFTNDGDYTMTSRRVSLSAETTTQCVEIQLIEDTIVEMDELFLVQLEQILSSEDLVFKPDPEYIEVTITDNDGMLIYLVSFHNSIICLYL